MARSPGKIAASAIAAPPRAKKDKPPPIDPKLQELKDQAEDLGVARKALDDAVSMTRGLWISFISLSAYLMVAVGSVTHVDLFLENPLELPLVGVKVPLVVFFWLAPILYLIVHIYLLLNLKLMSDNVRAWRKRLNAILAKEENLGERDRIRKEHKLTLPNFLPVQIMAAPNMNQRGLIRFVMATAVKMTVVFGPVALLFLFQAQFLPYHSWKVTAWHRVFIFADMFSVWYFWRRIIGRGKFKSPVFNSFTVIGAATVFPLSFLAATFPGETLYLPYFGLREILFEGPVNEVTGKPGSFFANRLVLTNQNFVGPEEALAKTEVSQSLRGRHLEGAVFVRTDLRKADFTGAKMAGAIFDYSKLQGARFECGIAKSEREKHTGLDELVECVDLEGGSLEHAELQDANFERANLKGASFRYSDLRGASLIRSELQGADLELALLQRASLRYAEMQGAWLQDANLQGSDLFGVKLQAAFLSRAKFQGADVRLGEFQGAFLETANFQGALLNFASLQGAKIGNADFRGALLKGTDFNQAQAFSLAGWEHAIFDARNTSEPPFADSNKYKEFVAGILNSIPEKYVRGDVLDSLSPLDPAYFVDPKVNATKWSTIEGETIRLPDYVADSVWPNSVLLRARVRFLRDLACAADGSPQVADGLIIQGEPTETLEDSSIRSVGPFRKSFVGYLLNKDKCPGAIGISGKAIGLLKKMLNDHGGCELPLPDEVQHIVPTNDPLCFKADAPFTRARQ
jgi:uncharacterized protein YjbI with pentapeptide repeats